MSDFDPGPSWRMEQFDRSEVPVNAVAYHEADGSWTYWVREALVPALPTAPYTVIRVTWKVLEAEPDYDFVLTEYDLWHQIGSTSAYDSATLGRRIESLEVLSEPRAVTAKAVLERVRDAAGPEKLVSVGLVDVIAREFGVGS